MSNANTDLEDEVKKLKLLLEQEKGKVLAMERTNYEIKREAKQTEEQARAMRDEANNALLEGADQMKVALCVSQGIWALAHMGRAFLARKIAAGRVVHREKQLCLLMQQIIEQSAAKDDVNLKATVDRAKSVISTIDKDGEQARIAAAEASLSYGVHKFEETFDKLVTENNSY